MDFHKYQATGNDFVMIDNRERILSPQDHALFERMCHRRFGIGADGVILVQHHADYAFEMLYYNSDGRPSTMCGNGGRCVVRFAEFLRICTSETAFLAVDGPHRAHLKPDVVELEMILPYDHRVYSATEEYLHTGSPHHIVWVAPPEAADIRTEGARIRYSPQYAAQGGTNVNFVQALAPGKLAMRTYERGVEDETYSCGTGVTAAAAAHRLRYPELNSVTVKTPGGMLSVRFEDEGRPWLCGPAVAVFSGRYPIA
ncbi:MAG: diaminopimelate epimerase [Bacteroidetes bacterium]|nr:diaminopimelate epimerase [Bacteroidota bacterium]